MPDLRLDLDALAAMKSDLDRIHASFDGAEAMSETVASYVGHSGLENTVRDFASKWNIHRGELLERIAFVASAVEAIHDTMVETDRALAASLQSTDAADGK